MPDGRKSPFCCENWEFLLQAPFLISGECCRVMKKIDGAQLREQKQIKAHDGDDGRGEPPAYDKLAENGVQRL